MADAARPTTSRRVEIFAREFLPSVSGPSPSIALSSFAGSAAAFAAAALALRPNALPFVLVVTPGLPEADSLVDDLRVLEKECPIRALEFPPPLEDDRSSTAARLKVAAVLGAYRMNPHPLVVVAPMPALLAPVPRAAAVAAATVRLALDDASAPPPPFEEVQRKLLAAGYERAAEVSSVGQFSVRGGVLDAWPPDAAQPIRAEYFGDDLESLRTFDPATQVSVGKILAVELPPVDVARDSRLVARDDANESQSTSHEPRATNHEPRATNHEPRTTNHDSLLSVLPDGCAAMWLEHNSYAEDLRDVANAALKIYVGDPAPQGVPTGAFQSSPLPGFAEMRAPAGGMDPQLVEMVRGKLKAHLVAAQRKGALVAEDDELAGGFEIPGLVVAAKSDRTFAARRRTSRAAAQPNAGERVSEAMDLEPGELVVHVDYGIGRYLGTTEIEVNGARSEVFSIEYADGGKLHVPVAHAHLLSRYVGVKGEHVKLHRLDGRRWSKEKSAAQKSVRDLAAALLETQARRAVVPGFAYDLEQPGIDAFEAAFPYEPTRDQARAIDDVKRDLAAPKPMDRLVCGDAGYGKTEVAMRAAFVAAMNGKQVAVLAPTTVLAEQHYETFLARFDGTPVRIETLSRFVAADAKAGVRARLASGATDIVIGTHAILSEKVSFHDLGLIIIDEEQRFGVRHKEWLKSLRATADVLTLSATPIPRTLYLSMTGARDLSLLRTPPRERVAVETKIVRDVDDVVRSAIVRELARGGQVYYLFNRVATISHAEKRVRALVPEAKVEVAHAQMPSAVLAEKMRRFAKGETNVLVCTTIVESGLDIPRANTILVDHADRFGLAELYQLRGRVGRSSRPGYAFFLLPFDGIIDAEARERLDALKKHGGLGAGFNVAMRDLEIRGAGNLLGKEQSGHIAAVGFQLYCQLLQRTVARLKGEDVPDLVDVSVNLDFLDFSPGSADAETDGASLPYDYVEDEAQRMDFHKRLAETATMPAVRKLKSELADRYGRLPKAAARLVRLAEFRVRCAEAGISRLDVKGARAVFYKRGTNEVAFVGTISGNTPDRKITSLFKLLEGE